MQKKGLDRRCQLPCILGPAPLSNTMEKEAARSPSQLPCFFLAGPHGKKSGAFALTVALLFSWLAPLLLG